MIDHMGFPVADVSESRRFYDAALAPLGLTIIAELTPEQTESGGCAVGYGKDGNPFFWIGDNEGSDRRGRGVAAGTHVAFEAASRAEVDAFHAAALSVGGIDHGAPGLRPQYGPTYYAAFVMDPNGANIEAVCYADE